MSKADLAAMDAYMQMPNQEESRVIEGLIAAATAPTLCTDPVDREACIAAFSDLYADAKRPAPEFVFFSSPRALQEHACKLASNAEAYRAAVGETVYPDMANERISHDHPDVRRMRGIARYTSESMPGFYQLGDCAKEAEQACIPEAAFYFAPRSFITLRCIDTAVEALAADAIGLAKESRVTRMFYKAMYTCGAAEMCERYCFITDRPARIVHPAFTPGAAAGRCRIEWRDGYAYEMELDGE